MSAEPTLDEWRALYAAAARFRDASPWSHLTDTDLIAVERPESPEVAYCAVMGAGGEEYGLLACLGDAGLLGYTLMSNDGCDQDEALVGQDCLAFTLVSRDALEPRDRDVIKALGLSFRGRHAWPLFRRYRPNLLPSGLAPDEASFLALSLDQVALLSTEAGSVGPTAGLPPDETLRRRRDQHGAWQTVRSGRPRVRFAVEFDRGRLDRTAQRLQQERGTRWAIRLLALAPVSEAGAPPFWARTLLCVDEATGALLPVNVLGPGDSVLDAFVDTVEKAGFVPEMVSVTSQLLELQLAPAAESLDTAVRRVDHLPLLDEAREFLTGAFV